MHICRPQPRFLCRAIEWTFQLGRSSCCIKRTEIRIYVPMSQAGVFSAKQRAGHFILRTSPAGASIMTYPGSGAAHASAQVCALRFPGTQNSRGAGRACGAAPSSATGVRAHARAGAPAVNDEHVLRAGVRKHRPGQQQAHHLHQHAVASARPPRKGALPAKPTAAAADPRHAPTRSALPHSQRPWEPWLAGGLPRPQGRDWRQVRCDGKAHYASVSQGLHSSTRNCVLCQVCLYGQHAVSYQACENCECCTLPCRQFSDAMQRQALHWSRSLVHAG